LIFTDEVFIYPVICKLIIDGSVYRLLLVLFLLSDLFEFILYVKYFKESLVLKPGPRSIITIIIVFTLCNCIDPYTPKLSGYESLLVVESLITDANSSYTIKLSRTFQEQNTIPAGVAGAVVSISDDSGNNSYLSEKRAGIYKTDSTIFRGTPGKTYVLHIHTKEGAEYESEQCLMQSVPDIDSVYFAKDQQFVNNQSQLQDGVMVCLDSKQTDKNQYLRWDFEEVWKFRVPYPKKYNYILNTDDANSPSFTLVNEVKEFCWKSRKSDEILIYSDYSGFGGAIKKAPVSFIPSNKTDRFTVQYSILVSQYSISKREYDFWDNLKQVNVAGGDIFAKQPFTVISNIHNVSNTKERVLGYFQVSAVKKKRSYLTLGQFANMGLPYYHYPCELIIKEPLDYPNPCCMPPPTWDDLYTIFCRNSDYYFVEPIYTPFTFNLIKFAFAKAECANCEVTGTSLRPDFWIDLH
jgi:hypothetical protein